MSSPIHRFIQLMLLALACAALSIAWAGEYFDKDGVALRGHDAVAYFNREVQKQWSADVPGFVRKADQQWPAVSRQSKVIE